MRPVIREVALDVLFEHEAIDHDRRDGFLFLLLRFRVARIGILHHQHEAFGIRRPREVLHAPLLRRELLRLAARGVQEPDLVVFVLVAATGKKGDPLPIGAPARMRLRIFAKSDRAILRAVPLREPKIRDLLVLLQVHRADDVDDRVAVRRNVRLIDIAQPGKILRLQQPRRLRAPGRGKRKKQHRTQEWKSHIRMR